MIMHETNTVDFSRYRSKYELIRDVCDCGSKFENVILDRSDGKTLHVKCSNEKCLQHTLATRKGR